MGNLKYSIRIREVNLQVKFLNALKSNDIQIPMDGKYRALDNFFSERLWKSLKYEHIYLNVYEYGADLNKGLKEYF